MNVWVAHLECDAQKAGKGGSVVESKCESKCEEHMKGMAGKVD
jgi:hypothetical protein